MSLHESCGRCTPAYDRHWLGRLSDSGVLVGAALPLKCWCAVVLQGVWSATACSALFYFLHSHSLRHAGLLNKNKRCVTTTLSATAAHNVLCTAHLLTLSASCFVLPAALHLHRQGIGKQLLDLVKEVAELAG